MTLKEFLNLDYIDINKKSVRMLMHITPLFAKFGLYNTLHPDTNDQDDIEKYVKQLEEDQDVILVKIDGETYMSFNLYAIDDNLLDALKIEKFVIDNNQYDIPTFVVTVGK